MAYQVPLVLVNGQIEQLNCAAQNQELFQRRSTEVRRDAAALAGIPQHLSIGVREAPDHIRIVTRFIMNVKR